MFAGIWYNILRGVAKVAVIINVSQSNHSGQQMDCNVFGEINKTFITDSVIQNNCNVVIVWYLVFDTLANSNFYWDGSSCLCIENETFSHKSNSLFCLSPGYFCLCCRPTGFCHLLHFRLHPSDGLPVHVQPKWLHAWVCQPYLVPF